MFLSKEDVSAKYLIKNYSAEGFYINDQLLRHSIILTTTHLQTWSPRCMADLTIQDWDPIISLSPEILIIGIGRQFHYPKVALLAPLYEYNVGFEIMDTAAACRTITLLLAEKRAAIAALMID